MKYFIKSFFLPLNLLLLNLAAFPSAHALEIDERLTLRIVKTSETKKTVLINRGKEDGLVKGDHAKFYLSVGVVARGVAIKISPGRSVWSLYRLVNADYIQNDQVMKLKITAPVKITKDESRSLVSDDTSSGIGTRDPRDLGIPLAAGAQDLDFEAQGGNRSGADFGDDGLNLLEESLVNRNREIFGALSYESRSSNTKSDNSNLDFSGSDASMLMDAGFEYYFSDESKWYSRLSLLGAFRMIRTSSLAYEGSELQENSSFFGGGFNWYPFTRPSNAYRFIPFGQVMYYMGSVSSNITSRSGEEFSGDLSGSVSMISVGGGLKYYIHNGWGASAKLEYQSRVDSFSEEEGSGLSWQKASGGPRFVIALRYRF